MRDQVVVADRAFEGLGHRVDRGSGKLQISVLLCF